MVIPLIICFVGLHSLTVIVSFDESSKSHHISDIVTNAYISDESVVIIDDVEIAVNYAKIENVLSFSNKLYQTLLTLLRTEPNKNHKLVLLVTCSDRDFFEVISKYFDMTFIIGGVEKLNGISGMSIRKVLNLMDLKIKT